VTNPGIIENWRAEFCAWFNVSHGFYEFYLMGGDKYKSQEVQIAWEAWRTARESVVIKPSEAVIISNGELYIKINYIEAQGYRVRGEG